MKKNRIISIFSFVILLFLCTGIFCGCELKSNYNRDFWFSDYKKTFVPYIPDSPDNTLKKAGTYWTMESRQHETVTIKLTTNCTLNDKISFSIDNRPISGKGELGLYQCIYKNVRLSYNSKLTFHARWTNAEDTNSEGFKILLFKIITDEGDYTIYDMTEK